ncbi:toll/interleukin-1 receptor domain-containing protein [Aeromonas dhakensis]|uniref:toll/interleukin-1 receptor domain-containing protein n=1 Tax=Aeromonas dhakensis TaxID=196024 RepID=UPI001B3930D0|nr:toll/interleukin-1 receptor domain-containing protein [Aeromonas dhakensis]MBQ4679754.1 TIR domain-containing protein [Aeromonas dhakensis]
MKAFLSHSSMDKEFVREVANQLGRINCVFDEKSFSSGLEFKTEIERHLENSSVFIFFASKDSLASFWCNFEMEQAFYTKLKGGLSAGIVYLIDPIASHDALPSWLKTRLIKHETSPAAIARDIKYHLSRSADEYQQPIYIGRAKERELLEESLNPIDESDSPRVIAIFGLPGVGRRALIRNSTRDLYGLNKIVEIYVEAGDNANTICAKLADIIEPYSCQDELRDIVDNILNLSIEDAIKRSIYNIENIIASNELPILVDSGGLTLNNGCLPEYINTLVNGIMASSSAYLNLVLTRRISYDNPVKISCVSVEQLSGKATSQLLSKLAQRAGVFLNPENNRELAEYVNGYPPAAKFAIKQASLYSVDALVNDKRKLTQFSQKRFINHIQDHNLDECDVMVLQALSSYSPLPLTSLISLYNRPQLDAHDKLYEMIDCSLIRVIDGQLYRIADPIKGSVNEIFGYASKDVLNKILRPLEIYVDSTNEDCKLELSRVLYRLGFVLNNNRVRDKGIKLDADYIKLLEDAYHQRKYKEAIELGYDAITHCPDSAIARTFLIKALIQEEKWEAAQNQIDVLYPIDEYRNIYYLQGFLERKKGEFEKAINALDKAEAHGRKGFALYREFSHCYLMRGDLDPAGKYIEKALLIQPNNNQVIDMAARVAIKLHDENTAKKYIDRLELLDKHEHFKLRLSNFHLVFGREKEALVAARESVSYGGSRFFSGRAQLIKSLTKNKKFDEADTEVSSLNSDFPNSKNDIKIALRCILEIEKGDFLTALKILDGFINKTAVQYIGLKRKCLEKIIKDITIPYSERRKHQTVLADLPSLSDIAISDIDLD